MGNLPTEKRESLMGNRVTREELAAVLPLVSPMCKLVIMMRGLYPEKSVEESADYLRISVAELLMHQASFLSKVVGMREETAKRERVIMLNRRVEEMSRRDWNKGA